MNKLLEVLVRIPVALLFVVICIVALAITCVTYFGIAVISPFYYLFTGRSVFKDYNL